MRTMVIGGAGFIGSHLCDKLIESGNTVTCVDNLSMGGDTNIRHLADNKSFDFCKCDADSLKDLDKVFEDYKPEYVFHLAANSDIQASALNPEVEYKNTYTTTFNILMCMRKHGVKKLFFASTSAVYGDKRDVILDESTPNLEPISYYGAAKLGSEALISAFSYMNDIEALVFRFPNVIGPRLTHGVIFDFIDKLKHNPKELQILGDGKQTKPYIYVLDLVDAICRFANTGVKGVSLYNLCPDGETSVTRIADIVCSEMELNNVKYLYTGGEGGWKGDVPRFKYCADKIKAMGWVPTMTSDQAVRETVKNNV